MCASIQVSRLAIVSSTTRVPSGVMLTRIWRPSSGCWDLSTNPLSARQFTVRVIDGVLTASRAASCVGVWGPT